jgi:hypothetical protein
MKQEGHSVTVKNDPSQEMRVVCFIGSHSQLLLWQMGLSVQQVPGGEQDRPSSYHQELAYQRGRQPFKK